MPENPKKIKRGFLEEKEFKREYQKYVDATGNSENPYDVEHFYNYSQLFDDTGGIMPHMTSDNHLPSEYKELGHPNLYVEGKNTKAEYKYGGNLMKKFKKKYAGGGPINPYMYYAGGPMQYKVGGKVWKNIAAGLYGAGEGILDTITMSATDQLTDRGFEYLTKVGNKNLDLNDPDDVKFLKTQQQVKGYSNAAGAIGTAVVTGNVQGAISQGTKGLNTAFQASDWASDDFKKWSQGISGVAGMASGFAGGLNSDSFNAAAKAGTGIAGFGQKAGKIGSFGNQVTGMFGGNQQPLWQQAQAEQDRLNSPEYATQQAEDDFTNLQQANKMSGYLDQSKVTFAMGGNLQEFEGPVHEEGGIQLTPEAEVEGGETKKGNYIFSDRLKVPGKKRTFAQLSKDIKKKYTGKRPNDPIDMKAEERELATLQDMQETVRGEIMSDAYMMAYGGFLKKKKKYFDGGGIEDLPGFIQPTTKVNPEDLGLNFTESLPLDFTQKAASKYNFNETDNNINIVDSPDSNNMFGMQDSDYLSAGVQSLAGLSQLYYGLQGPDEIPKARLNLARPNRINMTPAKRLASQEIDLGYNAVDASIRDNAPSSGSYLSNRITSAIKRARSKGEILAKLYQEEELQNASIMNNFNQFNAGVLNQEEQLNLAQRDKEIAELDASRMAVTEGLNNIGQSVGQTTRDKRAYDWQKVLAKNWMGTDNIGTDVKGNKYYKSKNGNFYIDGSPVPKELIG